MAVDYAINPAVFDKEVTILKEYTVFDETNTPQSKWHPFAKVRASIEPLSGREYWQAAQAQGEASIRIIIRYRKGITDRMHFRYDSEDGSVVYEMKSPPINCREQNMYLELMCKELSTNATIE